MVTINTAKKLEGIDFTTKRFVGVTQFHPFFKGKCACGKAISYGCLLVDIQDQGYTSTRKNKHGFEYSVLCYTSGVYVGSECIKHVAGNMTDEMKKAMNEFKKTLADEVNSDPETTKLRHEARGVYFSLLNLLRALQCNSAEAIRTEHNIEVKTLGWAVNGMNRAYYDIPNKPANIDTAQAAYRRAIREFREIAKPFLNEVLIDWVVAKDHSHSDKAAFRAELMSSIDPS